MKKIYLFLLLFIVLHIPAFAVETAPRISDREIIEKLATLDEKMVKLEEGQKNLDKNLNKRIDDVNKRIDDLRSDINRRFDDVNTRFDELRSDMNQRFEILTWMIGLFIGMAMIILGYMVRLQWLMREKQVQVETVLETHKDELAFLKNLIEKLLPPKGIL